MLKLRPIHLRAIQLELLPIGRGEAKALLQLPLIVLHFCVQLPTAVLHLSGFQGQGFAKGRILLFELKLTDGHAGMMHQGLLNSLLQTDLLSGGSRWICKKASEKQDSHRRSLPLPATPHIVEYRQDQKGQQSRGDQPPNDHRGQRSLHLSPCTSRKGHG